MARRAGEFLLPAGGSGRIEEVVNVTVRKLLIGAVALSVAVLAPAALAADRPDDQAGPIGVGGVAATSTATATRPDDRSDRFTPGNVATSPTRPDDRAERFTPGSTSSPAPTAATGFDWTDPLAVGALAALAAAAAALAAYVVVHRGGGGTGTATGPGTPAPTH